MLCHHLKKLPISLQIGMSLANALNSIGYRDTILLCIGKSDIYQHKSLGKSATDFYQNIPKPERVTINIDIGCRLT